MNRTRPKNTNKREKVLRFRASERRLHWAIAVPFLVCYLTALVLVVRYNPDPLRPHREVLSWVHRISGLFLLLMPTLAVVRGGRDMRVHFYNVRQAWRWVWSDVKWLAIMAVAMVNKRVALPEQGKFNAAQKLNFMMVMSTYPFYIITGLAMWLTGATLLAWLVHFGMAIIATPFLFGHLFMATIPRDTRAALQGMFTGFVDRQWAKHHHARWYQENFANAERAAIAVMPSEHEDSRDTARAAAAGREPVSGNDPSTANGATDETDVGAGQPPAAVPAPERRRAAG